jgi:cysteine desulfurase / selenocysteine lyase
MNELKKDFPLLKNNKIIYFDNAATSQLPKHVIDMLNDFYTNHNAPIKRGIYRLAEEATQMYEDARAIVAQFIGAQSDEIVFTSGATESINFIATGWGNQHIRAGDEIVITELEHHSNLLPWQQLALQKGATLKYISVRDEGTLDLSNLDAIITTKTKIVSFLDVSNAIGTHVDVAALTKAARAVGAKVLIDACQSVPHQKINVKEYDCDFLVFSGHKMLASTGIGVLYIKKDVQHEVPPYQFGGGMVFEVGEFKSRWLKPPHCYEAGTPPVAQAIGLAAAINYLTKYVDFTALKKHEAALCTRMIENLHKLPDISILGPIEQLKKMGHLVSFTHKKHHFHDVAAYLDSKGICVRAGHYCAQPLARKLGIDGSIRASFYLYNSISEVDEFLDVIGNLK